MPKPWCADGADPLADPAEADDAERAAEDVAADPAGPRVVVAGRQRRRHLGEVLREADHHREDVLADALRVRPRRVDDLDAALGGGVDVDLVVADPVAADHLEVLARNPSGPRRSPRRSG